MSVPDRFILRSIHNGGVSGLTIDGSIKAVRAMDKHGRVFLSSVAPLQDFAGNSDHHYVGCSANGALFIVNAVTGDIYREESGDLSRLNSIAQFRPSVIPSGPGNDPRRHLVGSVECMSNGSIFAFLIAYNLADGAPIIQLDRQGRLMTP
jgi:hypothetical protein